MITQKFKLFWDLTQNLTKLNDFVLKEIHILLKYRGNTNSFKYLL